MKKSTIEIRKQFSKLNRDVENNAKTENCLLCNKKLTSQCNSHIVPQFILKEIAEEGKVSYGATFFTSLNDIIDTTKGLNNAFTFKLICPNCDKKRFAKYEDPEVVLNFDNLTMEDKKEFLSEMAIKNHLGHIWMKRNEFARSNLLFPHQAQIVKALGIKTAYEIDEEEHMEIIKKINNSKKKSSFPYKILFNELLDFKTNIAAQTILSYVYDLRGKKIFNRKDFRDSNIGRYFYLTIFPYKDKTRIIFYIKKTDEAYVNTIIEDFEKLSYEDKIHFIFVSLVTLDEQFFVKPSLAEKMKKDKSFVKLYKQTDGLFNNWKYCKKINKFKKYKNYLLPQE